MRYKYIVLFALVLLVQPVFAQVIITDAVGGGAISADTDDGTYTSLTAPAFTETFSGDIANGTVVITAPAGFEFDIGGTAPTVLMTRVSGGGPDNKNINGVADGTSMAITSRTTTAITFTITDDSDGVVCRLTFQDIRIRPSDGVVTAGNLTDAGTSFGGGNCGALAVVPGVFAKLQLILPGETAVPGPIAGTGKAGAPSGQIAGTTFVVTVNGVDAHYNVVNVAPIATDVVTFTSTDADAVLPTNGALVLGTNTYSVKFKTAGSFTLTATDFDDGSITASISPSVIVSAGAVNKLQLLMPGETADPGSTTGKTGSPTAQVAGVAFAVTVNAVDACWNLVTTVTDVIAITSSDPDATLPANAALVGGTNTYSITPKTAGSFTFTASDVTTPATTASTSPATVVNVGVFTKLQILLPGQTADPGSATGFTGTAFSQSVGTSFAVTVNAVDACFNLVTTVTDVVGITSTDGSATLPSDAALVGGTKPFSVILNAAGIWNVTATDITDGAKTADTKSVSTVLSVLTLAIGGSAISADDQGGAYTSLIGPIFKEGTSGDVGTGTVILNAPPGVIFDVTSAPTLLMDRVSGAGADALNINGLADGSTIALTSISTTQITFTVSTASSGGVLCQLTFQNVKVRPSTGEAGEGNLTSTGTSAVNGVTSSLTSWGIMKVIAGTFAKMQILVPGETSAPGTISGRTGAVTAQAAGTSFNVTVNAVDVFWNLVNTVTDVVGITSSDADATLPGNSALVAGTKTLTVTPKTTGGTTFTATNITDGSKTAHTSSSVTVVAGSFSKLQILLPGEVADPGSTLGKTGAPTDQTAGTAFNVTVNAVDACWNIITTETDVIGLTASDVNATLPANAALALGTRTFSITLKTSDSTAITALNITDGTVTPGVSDSVWVATGAFSKLQILVPGEVADPGSATGKTGATLPQSNTKAFTITVNAVDACWNVVTTATDNIGITSDEGSATLPANNTLSSGTQTFSFTFNNSGTYTITATDLTNGGITPNTSASILVEDAILTEATGGGAISADDFGTTWTTLTGAAYAEGSTADVGVGTITLDAPAGFIFDVGGVAPTVLMTRTGGGGPSSKNINGVGSGTSMAITSISSTQIIFTVTGPSNSGAICSLTWQNVRVRPSTGAVATGNLLNSGTSIMTVIAPGTNFGTLTIVPGAFSKMQLLVPGETSAPGTASGKTGAPSNRTAGTAFNVTVNAVDDYWNLVPTAPTNLITLTTADGNATVPAANNLAAGTQTFSVTLKTTGTQTITATNTSDGTKTSDTSPNITVVAGAFVKLQLLVPGEVADPGSATGKTAALPSAQTAGTSFSVTVNAVDACWNVVTSVHTVGIISSDANANLPTDAPLAAGTKTFTVTLKTVGTATLTANDISDGSKTADTSPSITVNAGAFVKLQILVPGETAAPGTVSGKTGTPLTQKPGTVFTVTVNAVDACWNIKTLETDVVGITSSDGTATLPANAALVAGTQDFSFTFNALGTFNITATDITNGLITANLSSDIVSGNKTWTGGALTSLWGDAANWDPIGVPIASECILLNGAHTIDINVAGVCLDLILNNPALTLTILTGNSLAVGGDFTITDGIFATQEAWPTVVGTTTITDGTVVYNGVGAQTIENSVTYKTLRFDNSLGSMTVEAGGDILATDGLEMYSGNVDMNSQTIQLGSVAAAPLVHLGAITTLFNGTFSRYMDAATAITSAGAPLSGLFPVGTATDYRPFEVNSTVSPTGAGLVSATHVGDASATGVIYTDNEGDDIEEVRGTTIITTTITGGTYDVAMTYSGIPAGGVLSDLKLETYDGTMGSAGASAANSGSVTNPVVGRTGLALAELSKSFVIGTMDKSATPLPVTLLGFDAQLNDRGEVDINWQTVAEINNNFFIIEKSMDGVNFVSFSKVKGAGNSNHLINYSEIDATPFAGVSYYRLKQTDFDGDYSYSHIVAVTNIINDISFLVYPNPSVQNDEINIIMNGLPGNDLVSIRVFDLMGKQVYSRDVRLGNDTNERKSIQVKEELPKGNYILKINSAAQFETQKLVIQ